MWHPSVSIPRSRDRVRSKHMIFYSHNLVLEHIRDGRRLHIHIYYVNECDNLLRTSDLMSWSNQYTYAIFAKCTHRVLTVDCVVPFPHSFIHCDRFDIIYYTKPCNQMTNSMPLCSMPVSKLRPLHVHAWLANLMRLPDRSWIHLVRSQIIGRKIRIHAAHKVAWKVSLSPSFFFRFHVWLWERVRNRIGWQITLTISSSFTLANAMAQRPAIDINWTQCLVS